MSDSTFDFAAKIAEGYGFVCKNGEWNVTTPAGRHGAGPTPEDAIANVDSQIVVREGKRVLIRADQSELVLDRGSLQEAPAEEAVSEPVVPAKKARRGK